jgi:predicted transcriptional regulator
MSNDNISSSVNATPEVETKARNIYSALSNSDSLRIFNLAASGIDASTSVLEKYQFSKKRYYGRLKELVDLGLVAKADGEYRHTTLGNLVYESQVKDLEQILLNKVNIATVMQMKARVKKNPTEAVPRELISDIETSTGISNLEPVKFYDNWNELSMDVAIEIETMKSEVCVATRYMDFRTAEAALRAASNGRKIAILHSSRNGLSTKLQLMGNLMTHPKALGVFKELATNSNVSMCESIVPYSFLVIDGQIVGLEIVNPEDPYSFFFGLKFRNEGLAAKVKTHFEALAKSAEKDTIASIIESNRPILEKGSAAKGQLVSLSEETYSAR